MPWMRVITEVNAQPEELQGLNHLFEFILDLIGFGQGLPTPEEMRERAIACLSDA